MGSRTFTAGEIIDRIRSIGCYENLDGDYSGDSPAAPSSGTLLRFIDLGHRRAWEAWSSADEGWNLVRQTASLIAGDVAATLPSDIHRLRAVQVSNGAGWLTLERANDDDDISTDVPGTPVAYRILQDTLELLPPPSSGLTLRLSYTPEATRISSSLQVIPGDDGFDEVVAYDALVQCREREEKDTATFERHAAGVEAEFRAQVKRRDRGAPVRMRPRGGATDPRWWRRYGR